MAMTRASTWAYTMSCSETGRASASRALTGSRPGHPEVLAEVLAVLVAGDEVADPVHVALGQRLVEVEVLATWALRVSASSDAASGTSVSTGSPGTRLSSSAENSVTRKSTSTSDSSRCSARDLHYCSFQT